MKIVVCGNYGAKNLGDEMILEGLLTTLKSIHPKSIHPNVEVTVLSGNPKETLEQYSGKFTTLKISALPKFPAGIRSVIKRIFTGSRSSNSATDEAVRNCDYFILGGGGLFGSLTFRANLIWAIQALKAYKHEKSVIIYGQSISPIRWRFARSLVRKIFQKASLITVRDEASKEELQKLGVTKEIHIIPDLAFRIENSQNTNSALQKPIFIVALRQMPNLTGHFLETIAEFLEWLITNYNYQIKFINFQEGAEGDNKLHQKVIALVKNQKITGEQHLQIIKNIPDTRELLQHFAGSDFVLGMRLHAIITAIKTATPFIALSYSPKVENFLKNTGLTDTMADLNNLNFENLKSSFEKIVKNKTVITENLQKINQQASKDHLEFEKNLNSAVDKKNPI